MDIIKILALILYVEILGIPALSLIALKRDED